MTLPSDQTLQKIQFYVTSSYNCGYLPNRLAQSLIASPQHLIDADAYSDLIQLGFRRSGKFAYRPHCEHCQECIPVRIVLQDFISSRSQKRAHKLHKQLTTAILPVAFHHEHYALYANYQKLRHPNDLADLDKKPTDDDAEQYQNFLCQTNVESVLIEFRDKGQLKMVSVIDIVRDGISAVYTFYDATDTKASYGTYNVLWQINWAKQLNLPYLYLGYLIKESKKMAYKQKFSPQEKLINGEWIK
ncbi:putative arginyl-tRNA--protein transferase [mine drainage metagenome]|uniref:Putative arginyl-tRNA--protein transferase n=1 Tax=mine drainage metagenome TaxID=410659 RepID=A0A1J5RLF2_9ZZZZ